MAETKTHLLLAYRLGFIDHVLHGDYQSRLVELGKMLHGYISHLRKQKKATSVRDDSEKYEV